MMSKMIAKAVAEATRVALQTMAGGSGTENSKWSRTQTRQSHPKGA